MTKKPIHINSLELGRVPPQATDFEESVLGTIMGFPDALITAMGILKEEYFYKTAHQYIYRAICTLFGRSEPVDLLTVTEQLKTDGNLDIVGGAYYLSTLTNKSLAAGTEYRCRIIIQKFIAREYIVKCSEIVREAYNDTTDIFELTDNSQKKLLEIASITERKESAQLHLAAIEALDKIKKIRDDESGGWGVKCGITILDKLTRGFQPSDLIILAARPGMGKTALMVTFAKNIGVKDGLPIAIFSLEMNTQQLTLRLFSQEVGISYNKLLGGRFNDADYERLLNYTKQLPLTFIIDDTPALTLMELRAKALRIKMQYGVGMVFVDYLQLMRGMNESGQNREQQIGEISRGLKAIAKELNIPVMALSQLSRKVEDRAGDKRPKLSDLRESGSIEQDADMVMFIYRPNYYYSNEQLDDKGMDSSYTEIIVEKHRNGRTGPVEVKWIEDNMSFMDAVQEFEVTEDPVQNNNYQQEDLPF